MRWIPILGWMLWAAIWKQRHMPRLQHLREQLLARPTIPETIWGNDPERLRIAQAVAHSFVEEFLWPNDRFIPTDSLRLLMWPAMAFADREPLFACFDIEMRLGARKKNLQKCISLDPSQTLGDFVDRIQARLRSV